MVRVANDNKRVVQVGSHQRSVNEFQKAIKDNPGAQGINFIGTKGWIEVAHRYFASIEVGCSTSITCCPGNIAHELKRAVKWNPSTCTFVDDQEAANHRLMHYEYRKLYSLWSVNNMPL